MSKLKKYFITFFILSLFISQNKTDGQTNPEDPRFTITVKNISTTNPGNTIRDSILRFEVWVQQINQGQPGVNDLEYAAGQFTWSYNAAIQGNGNLFLSLFSAGSSLPLELRPLSFQVDSLNGYLKMSGNIPNSLTNFFIRGDFPGTRILTAQVRTSINKFQGGPLNLRFKLGETPNTYIRYFLPYPDSVDSEKFPIQTSVPLMDTINPPFPETPVYTVESPYWPPQQSIVDFNANATTILEGMSVNFSDSCTLDPLGWSWSFPGAVPSTSTVSDPAGIVYNSPGTYSVTLTAVNLYLSNSRTKTNYINVKPRFNVHLKVIPEGFYYPEVNRLSRRDIFTVFLRNATAPYVIIDSAKGVIDSVTFSNIFAFPKPASGNYYIIVKHLNSIETWSKSDGINIAANDTSVNYDFTTSAAQAYENNLQFKGGKYCLYSGDVDQNGFIDLSDLIQIFNDSKNFITGTYLPGDLNGDSIIDLTDIELCYNNSISFIRVRRP